MGQPWQKYLGPLPSPEAREGPSSAVLDGEWAPAEAPEHTWAQGEAAGRVGFWEGSLRVSMAPSVLPPSGVASAMTPAMPGPPWGAQEVLRPCPPLTPRAGPRALSSVHLEVGVLEDSQVQGLEFAGVFQRGLRMCLGEGLGGWGLRALGQPGRDPASTDAPRLQP